MVQKSYIQRLYQRYILNHPEIAWLESDGIKIGHLLEIGFGGCAAEIAPNVVLPQNLRVSAEGGSVSDSITLHYLDCSQKVRLGKHAVNGSRLGLEFYFENSSATEFIRKIILPLRYGAALRFMHLNGIENPAEMPSEYAVDTGIPYSLNIDGVDNREVPFLNLSMRHELVLQQFIREPLGLRTLHSVWPGGVTGDLRDTEPMDHQILRSAFGFFWTYSGGDRANAFCEIAMEILRLLAMGKDRVNKSPATIPLAKTGAAS